jgi:beta-galactosidase
MRIVLAIFLLILPSSAPAQIAASSEANPRGETVVSATAVEGSSINKAQQPNVVEVHKDDRGYQLMVDGTPTMVFGMNWGYMPIGENYTYDFWGKPDDVIIEALDAEMTLLNEMHVNVIRQYLGIPPRWVKYIFETYGIYTMLNHPVARYGMTIDGTWVNPVDYSDPRLRKLIIEEIRELVGQYKDTPGLMMWLLGNENNYGLVWKSSEIENLPKEQRNDARAVYLYSLYGEITDLIHELDKNHPVAIVNGDLGFINIIKEECPDIDVFGSNVYRGQSSSDIFERVEKELGIPFMYTEFGADAYDAKRQREDHISQARYLQALWQEIYEQSYGKGRVQNAIGGLIFQWSDGWWKYQQEVNLDVHDTTASWSNQAYQYDWAEGENNMNEEWFGICAKGRPDERGLYEVYPRTAYYMLQEAFTLHPYAPDTDLAKIRAHFGRLGPRQYADRYEGNLARAKLAWLERIRLSELRVELETFTTGGRQLDDPERTETRFDHMESFYFGAEARPTSRIRSEVIVNVLGNVANNPIDEIFYENRGQGEQVRNVDGEILNIDDNERVAVYQAVGEWDSNYFRLDYFYRVGHYHWGYEGDFFGLYPEAHYQEDVDTYDANTPNGLVFAGKKALSGLKVAFGPELWWGANPTVITKYYHTINDFKFATMHQEDIAKQDEDDLASSAIPQPKSRKTTLYLGYTRGKFTFELGGIMAGTRRIGDPYLIADKTSDSGYLESGHNILENEIRFEDTLGTRAKITLNMAPFFWYVEGGYRGLVSDAGVDQTMTITAWSLKESGQGNHWAASTGAAYYLGDFMLAPNILAQKPLEGPLSRDSGDPITGDFFDPETGVYYPGVRLRNQLQDPFWVRSNRETYGFEFLLGFDPTPATFAWAWDNLDREEAEFAAALDFVYRILPTSQDGGVAVAREGFTFAFNGAAPQKNLWDLSLRTIANGTPTLRLTRTLTFAPELRSVNWIYVGENQANGDSKRSITRWGTYGKLSSGGLALDYFVKVDDWGPYDYYEDFNLTFPLQLLLDLSYSFTPPKWFVTPLTRFGVRGKYRTTDKNSNRHLPDPERPGREGLEWEVKTYVHFTI